ncbi:MAG: hypothetical protein K0U59_10550 [Gammaproteobacteria bacterium]|nr:hypothetical protein [Gammaproteobacteria bacterium]
MPVFPCRLLETAKLDKTFIVTLAASSHGAIEVQIVVFLLLDQYDRSFNALA